MTQTQLREDAANTKPELAQLQDLERQDLEADVALDSADDGAIEAVKNDRPRRLPFLILGLFILGAGIFFGDRWWQYQQSHVTTENAQILGHISPVSAKISANVDKILVKSGDSVKAGQPLILLADPDLELKIQAAEAALAIAKAQLAGAEDTVTVTNQINPTQVGRSQANLAASVAAIRGAEADVEKFQAQIKTKQAAIAQAKTEVNRTKADYQRYKSLYDEGAISAQQFDLARANYDNAQSSLAAANQAVVQAQAELASGQAQLQSVQAQANAAQGQVTETQISGQNVTVQKDQQKQAQAQVDQVIASLTLARQQLGYLEIKAPVSGSVGQVTAQLGQKIQAGQPILSIVPLQTEQIYVQANFKETALGKLHLGEKAEIEVDAYPNEKFPAKVAAISPATGSSYALLAPDNATGNFNKVVQWVPVRLVFDADADPDNKLKLGLNVTAIVTTESAQ